MTKVDVFIPCHAKDFPVLERCVAGLVKHLDPPANRIVIVSRDLPPDRSRRRLERMGVQFHPEDAIPGLLSFSQMPDLRHDDHDRRGWYYQQLMKYAFRDLSQTEDYVVMDADTVLIRPVRLRADDGRHIFHRTAQHFPLYFATYEKLLGYRPAQDRSFIVNYLIFKKSFLNALLQEIEQRFPGVPWYQTILSFLDYKAGRSFSEFETYGYFVQRRFPDAIASVEGRNIIVSIDRLWLHPIIWRRMWRRGFDSISYHHHTGRRSKRDRES